MIRNIILQTNSELQSESKNNLSVFCCKGFKEKYRNVVDGASYIVIFIDRSLYKV